MPELHYKLSDKENMFIRLSILQMVGHSAMLTLVLELAPSSWMMSSVFQVPANYWSVLVIQLQPITVFTQLMLVWDVKVGGVATFPGGLERTIQCSSRIILSNSPYSSLYNWSTAIGGR